MLRRISACALAVMIALSLIIAVCASGGTAADPVVSKSYVDGSFFDNAVANAAAKIDSAAAALRTKCEKIIESLTFVSLSDDDIADKTSEKVLAELQKSGKYLYSTRTMTPISLKSGDVICGTAGTELIVLDGSSSCFLGSVINITKGIEVSQGTALGRNTTFMFSEKTGKIKITSDSARVMIDGKYSLESSVYSPKYTSEAYALKNLGLVKGAANGLELSRGNTRAESITMLIRLLGEEESALASLRAHPFTDVDAWAQKYVGYAYSMGYTNGVSPTRYDGSSYTTANQYVTFVLRALGYNDSIGDFNYNTAVKDAVRLGVLTSSDMAEMEKTPFYRDMVMHISYRAMSAKVKGSDKTLLAQLVLNGAVSGDKANEFLQK